NCRVEGKADLFLPPHFHLLSEDWRRLKNIRGVENAVGPLWTQVDDMLEENLASPKALKSPVILKQISLAENCSPLASTKTNCSPLAVVFEPAKTKSQHMSFNQTSLLKRNGKEKVLKTAAPPIFVPPLSEKRALGSYCGRIVESKINSFRRKPEHENRRHTMAAAPKSAVRTQSTSSIADKKDDRVTSTVNTSNANRSVHRTKKNAPTKTGLGPHLTGPVSEARGAVSALKSADGVRKHNPAKPAKGIRTRPAERPPLKGLKKLPPPISVYTLPERESFHQTIKEPVESFWSALADEDEQGLLSDSVNKTLVECLHLIEEGYPGDDIHSTLEKLTLSVPDAKKFAKYWVCQMRLEQFRSIEKVLAIYEKAILAGAQVRILKFYCRALQLKKGTKIKEKPADLQNEEQDSGNAEGERIQEFPTPETDKGGSYLIKYNLSTTPSLISTNKKIQGDGNHSAIKDLKFLTPVRRSSRIQKKVCRLPDMLKDHNPCVSSLEQLEEFGAEGIGFIYRHNSALRKLCSQQGQE
uniref:Cytoskeleton associated protein 2 n=1 Tax=Podarcis muralis TaxID=64176 RepID=A0A670I0U6_PODMU